MIVDYRKKRTDYAPILIDGAAVEQVESFKFPGVHITNKLTRSKHTTTVVKRARQSLFPIRKLKMIWHGSSDLQKVLQLQHREHHYLVLVASLPGTAIARPLTARHYRG